MARSRARRGDDFERTREEPVTFFRLRALHLAPSIGVDPAVADEAVAIVVTAFGERWLNEAATDFSPSIPLPFRRHPLGDAISTAGETQLAEILELAEYLKELKDSNQLPKVIEGLKAQYHQTLLQVAFAARMIKAGAEDVRLEPPAAEGRLSDFTFRFRGIRFRAECYRPTAKPDGEAANEMVRIAQSCLDVVRSSRFVYGIAVRLTVTPSAEVRREITNVVKRAFLELEADLQRDESIFPAYLLSGPVGHVSVCRALATKPGAPPALVCHPGFPSGGEKFDAFMRQGWATRADAAGVAGDTLSVEGMSHVALWLPERMREQRSVERDVAGRLETLGGKIEKKLAQTRADLGEARVLIVGTWMASRLDAVPEEVRTRLKRKIVDSHADVAGLLLVDRDWMQDLGRHGYVMRALLPDHGVRVPGVLLSRLVAMDRRPPLRAAV